MGLEIVEPNTCIRGCCSSNSIPLHLPASSYALLSPIARGAESVVYEGILDGRKVAVKKLFLSTSEDIDKFHKELQLICITSYSTTMSLDHLGIAKLVAAHAKPPSYLFFFKFYESGNLVGKLHAEEWSPSIDQVLMIAVQLGAAAAEFSVQALPGFPQSLASIRSPIDALFEAFVSTDAAFRNEINSHRKSRGVVQKDWHPGCTAVAALIVRNKLFVANVGDCRTILCCAGHAYPLSKDHVASCLEEREHAISAGGQVKWQVDTGRVGPAAL